MMKTTRSRKELTVTGTIDGKRVTVVIRTIPYIDGRLEVHFAYDDGVRVKVMTREEYHDISLGAVLKGNLKFDRVLKRITSTKNFS